MLTHHKALYVAEAVALGAWCFLPDCGPESAGPTHSAVVAQLFELSGLAAARVSCAGAGMPEDKEVFMGS